MAYPVWAGPFGLPTTRRELALSASVSGFLFGIGYGVWRYSAVHALERMAWHRVSPILFNRAALLALGRGDVVFPSISNAVSIYGRMLLMNPATIPLTLGLSALYIGSKFRPDEDPFETARVERAIDMARGFTDTSWMTQYGHFGELPYIENPQGDRIWYSFNPQDIDGSHR